MLVIKNGTLISMAGIYKEKYDVAVENGKIAKVEKEIVPGPEDTVIDAAGKWVLPGGIARIFVTFNSLFGNFLSFSIPLIILGLVTPAIGELGKGAGRLLALTALLAYGSTIFSGFFTYFSS